MEKQKEEYSTFASSVVWAIRIVKNKIKKNYIGFYHPTPRPPTIKEFRILTYVEAGIYQKSRKKLLLLFKRQIFSNSTISLKRSLNKFESLLTWQAATNLLQPLSRISKKLFYWECIANEFETISEIC